MSEKLTVYTAISKNRRNLTIDDSDDRPITA